MNTLHKELLPINKDNNSQIEDIDSYDEKKDKLSSKKLSFENESRSDYFVRFILILNRDLIKMNLPIMDYLDDFDRGIILAAAYKTITNDEKKLINILDDII